MLVGREIHEEPRCVVVYGERRADERVHAVVLGLTGAVQPVLPLHPVLSVDRSLRADRAYVVGEDPVVLGVCPVSVGVRDVVDAVDVHLVIGGKHGGREEVGGEDVDHQAVADSDASADALLHVVERHVGSAGPVACERDELGMGHLAVEEGVRVLELVPVLVGHGEGLEQPGEERDVEVLGGGHHRGTGLARVHRRLLDALLTVDVAHRRALLLHLVGRALGGDARVPQLLVVEEPRLARRRLVSVEHAVPVGVRLVRKATDERTLLRALRHGDLTGHVEDAAEIRVGDGTLGETGDLVSAGSVLLVFREVDPLSLRRALVRILGLRSVEHHAAEAVERRIAVAVHGEQVGDRGDRLSGHPRGDAGLVGAEAAHDALVAVVVVSEDVERLGVEAEVRVLSDGIRHGPVRVLHGVLRTRERRTARLEPVAAVVRRGARVERRGPAERDHRLGVLLDELPAVRPLVRRDREAILADEHSGTVERAVLRRTVGGREEVLEARLAGTLSDRLLVVVDEQVSETVADRDGVRLSVLVRAGLLVAEDREHGLELQERDAVRVSACGLFVHDVHVLFVDRGELVVEGGEAGDVVQEPRIAELGVLDVHLAHAEAAERLAEPGVQLRAEELLVPRVGEHHRPAVARTAHVGIRMVGEVELPVLAHDRSERTCRDESGVDLADGAEERLAETGRLDVTLLVNVRDAACVRAGLALALEPRVVLEIEVHGLRVGRDGRRDGGIPGEHVHRVALDSVAHAGRGVRSDVKSLPDGLRDGVRRVVLVVVLHLRLRAVRDVGGLDGHDGVVDVGERHHVAVYVVYAADEDPLAEDLGGGHAALLVPAQGVLPRELPDGLVDRLRVEIRLQVVEKALLLQRRDDVLDEVHALPVRHQHADLLLRHRHGDAELVRVVVGDRDGTAAELVCGIVSERVVPERPRRTGELVLPRVDDGGRGFLEREIASVRDEVELLEDVLGILGDVLEHERPEPGRDHRSLHLLVRVPDLARDGVALVVHVVVRVVDADVDGDADTVLSESGIGGARDAERVLHEFYRASGHRDLLGVGARHGGTLGAVAHERDARGVVHGASHVIVGRRGLRPLVVRDGQREERDLDEVRRRVVAGVELHEPAVLLRGAFGEMLAAGADHLVVAVVDRRIAGDDREVAATRPPERALRLVDDGFGAAELLDLLGDVLVHVLHVLAVRLRDEFRTEVVHGEVAERIVPSALRELGLDVRVRVLRLAVLGFLPEIGKELLVHRHPALHDRDHPAQGRRDARPHTGERATLHDVGTHGRPREGRREVVENGDPLVRCGGRGHLHRRIRGVEVAVIRARHRETAEQVLAGREPVVLHRGIVRRQETRQAAAGERKTVVLVRTAGERRQRVGDGRQSRGPRIGDLRLVLAAEVRGTENGGEGVARAENPVECSRHQVGVVLEHLELTVDLRTRNRDIVLRDVVSLRGLEERSGLPGLLGRQVGERGHEPVGGVLHGLDVTGADDFGERRREHFVHQTAGALVGRLYRILGRSDELRLAFRVRLSVLRFGERAADGVRRHHSRCGRQDAGTYPDRKRHDIAEEHGELRTHGVPGTVVLRHRPDETGERVVRLRGSARERVDGRDV